MRLDVKEITEIKVVSADVESEFIYIDRLKDGSWRLVYSKNLEDRFVLHERVPNIEVIDTKDMTMDEIGELLMKRQKK